MTMRRILAAFLSAGLLFTMFPGAAMGEALPEEALTEEALEEALTETEDNSVSREVFKCYIEELDSFFDLPLYFVNDVTDLPFVDLADWADVMVTLYESYGNSEYALYMDIDSDLAMYTRESNYSMLFDFGEGTIAFDDYDAFTHTPEDKALLDMVTMNLYNEKGESIIMERLEQGSFDRYGKEIMLNLKNYGIPMYWNEEDNLYLVPMQTLADFLLAGPLEINIYFNGEAVFLATEEDLGLDADEKTPLGEAYYSAPYGNMSEELARYNYAELCMTMDHLYGLKEIHDISSFDDVFQEIGYKHDLSDPDPNVSEGALSDFISYYLDDLHSGFDSESFRTEEMDVIGGSGLSSLQDDINGEIFYKAREIASGIITPYQEVGNTAYITFDHFVCTRDPAEYYKEGPADPGTDPSDEEMDTIGLILYAHQQICREGSPIENVVIDLSLNGGGNFDPCAFTAAWLLGEASMSIRSSLTGAISTGVYRVDANLDGRFDEKDTIADKNLYCLIGPYSFSCGNLLPNVLKSSNKVTLLGQTSGGGSCSVLYMSTPSGASYRISSPYRMSYLKNGSYYDIDLGVDPNCYITKPENFYNRQALTDYINQLF